jgi:hypothetical protein
MVGIEMERAGRREKDRAKRDTSVYSGRML